MSKPTTTSSTLSLTPKQKEVLEFIEGWAQNHGYAPSQVEIAKHFGFKSLGTVQNYLVRLERQGVLKKSWNAKRSLEVVRPEPLVQAIELPLLGRVAAGRPIEALESDESVEVPKSMLRSGEHYVLRVVGDSMIEEGILSGDLVIIKKSKDADNGQTVVALVDNEATIKKYYKRNKSIELHPANPAYEPIIIDSLRASTSFRIEGLFVGLLRRAN